MMILLEVFYMTLGSFLRRSLKSGSKVKPDWLKILYNDEEVGYVRTVSSYPNIEIGMDIAPNHRGKGYAKAAYRKLLESLTFKMYNKATLRVLKVTLLRLVFIKN